MDLLDSRTPGVKVGGNRVGRASRALAIRVVFAMTYFTRTAHNPVDLQVECRTRHALPLLYLMVYQKRRRE
jgi:hypothetical protein